MAKRNRKQPVTRFFHPSNPYDPFDCILSDIGNRFVTLGMKKISSNFARLMGLGGMSVADEIQIQRMRLSLARQEGNNTRAALMWEKQIRFLDMRIQEKEFEIQRRRERLENAEAQRLDIGTYPRMEIITSLGGYSQS